MIIAAVLTITLNYFNMNYIPLHLHYMYKIKHVMYQYVYMYVYIYYCIYMYVGHLSFKGEHDKAHTLPGGMAQVLLL